MRDAGPTERLAADKGLAFDACQEVADARERQEDGGGDERGGPSPVKQRQPLSKGHARVGGGAHEVGRDLADDVVELCRCGADAEEERHLDEED